MKNGQKTKNKSRDFKINNTRKNIKINKIKTNKKTKENKKINKNINKNKAKIKITKFFHYALIIFLIGVLLGFFIKLSIVEKSIEQIKSLAESVKHNSFAQIFFLIFFNNVRVAFLLVILGITFILPILIMLFNGLVVGSVLSINFEVLKLLPHGIFEIPALALAFELGQEIRIDLNNLKNKTNKIKKKQKMKEQIDIKNNLKIYFKKLTIIFALLFIAAIIETTLFKLQ